MPQPLGPVIDRPEIDSPEIDGVARRDSSEQARLQQRYLAISPTPEELPEVYTQFVDLDFNTVKAESVTSGFLRPGADPNGAVAERHKEEFVTGYERAWAASRGEIPFEWFAAQNPEDLKLFEEFADLAADVEELQYLTAAVAKQDKQIQEEVERRVDAAERGRTIARIGSFDFFNLADEVDEEEIEREVRDNFNAVALGTDLEKSKNLLQRGVDGTVGLLGKGLGAAASGIGNFLQAIDDGVSAAVRLGQSDGDLTNIVTRNEVQGETVPILTAAFEIDSRRKAEIEIAKLEESLGQSFSRRFYDTLAGPTIANFDQLEQEDPAVANELIDSAGGNRVAAMGIFGAGSLNFMQEDQEAIDQMEQYVESLEERDREMLTELKRFDFTPGAQVLGVLESYGKAVPMKLATGVALILSDSDLYSGNWDEVFGNLSEEIIRADYSPARVLDMDGSLAGLALDLGAGIAFDPVNWFFGARGAVRTVKPHAAFQAEQLAKSPFVQRYARDVYNHAISAERGPGGLMALLGWGDDIMRREILSATGFANKTLPLRDWARSKLALGAQEVEVSFARSLVDDVGEVSASLADDVAKNGWKEPIEITVSRANRGIELSDGAKRLAVADDMAVRRMPARIRVTNEPVNSGKFIDDLLDGDDLVTPLKEVGEDTVQTYVRPDELFPDRLISGEMNLEAVEAAMRRAIVERGLVPSGAHKTAITRAFSDRFSKLLNDTGVGNWIERYAVGHRTVTTYGTVGTHATDDLLEAIYTLGGKDSAFVDDFVQRLINETGEGRAAAVRHARGVEELRPLADEIAVLDDLTGAGWDDVANRYADVQGPSELKVALANRTRARRELTEKTKSFNKQMADLDKQLAQYGREADVISALYKDVWEEYNRKYIATNRVWKKFVDEETGLVPWDVLRKGRSSADGEVAFEGARAFLTTDMREAAKAAGIKNPEKFYRDMSGVAATPVTVQVPISPLEMLMARGLTGPAYTRAVSDGVLAGVRDSLWDLQRLWITDKVFRPSTAAVVSFDELLRIWSQGGIRQGFGRWMADRGIFLSARAKAALRGKFRDGVAHGSEYMSPAAQERIRRLTQADRFTPQVERQLFEGAGLGWGDIHPNDPGYLDAARRWTGNLIQDAGFRSFLRGRDAFREFFNSPQGEHLRAGTHLAVDKKSGLVASGFTQADDMFDGMETLFNAILKPATKNGRYDDVRKAFETAARTADLTSGQGITNLPEWVYSNLGDIRGVRKAVGKRTGVQSISEPFFDNLFMKPVNYRRGFLAEMTRETERARLTSLWATQGKQVMSDPEAEAFLGLRGYSGTVRSELRPWLHEKALDSGIIMESYMDDLIERTVRAELDNTLYSFDTGSRLGAQAKVVFPFGKPWADMAGYWGREQLRKPVAQGWLNGPNTVGIKSIVEGLPFNPKPAAMISRLSATDFTIDRGLLGGTGSGFLHEGGLIPGSDETDFSPLFFLPTGGENPFGVLLPGLGFLPIWAVDQYIGSIDPVENPVEWQERVNQISAFVPSVGFQQGGAISRVLGGGTTATMVDLAADAVGFFWGTPNYQVTSLLGDISREIDRTRVLSGMLADPEIWNEAMSLETVEEFETWLAALSLDADREASVSHGMETLTRFVIPASSKDHSALGEVLDIWVDAAEQFPKLGVRPSLMGIDLENDENRRQYSDDVRRNFFKLEQWERNAMIAEYPQLAVNLISSWEWTVKAQAEGMATQAYRTTGTKEGLALHQNLVVGNYVRPLQPIERARRIFGMVQAAQIDSAQTIYENQANRVNDIVWSTVDDDTMAMLESIVETSFADDKGIHDAREMWEKWSTLEPDLELWAAGEYDIDPVKGASRKKADQTAFDILRSQITIPSEQKPWGKTWPGLDPDEVTDRFNDLVFEEWDEESLQIAGAVGLKLEPGMSAREFFSQLRTVITATDRAAFVGSRSSYDGYIKERNLERSAVLDEFRRQVHNPVLDEEWREGIDNFMIWEESQRDYYISEVDGIPQFMQQEVVDRFQRLRMTDSGSPIDWDNLWDKAFARSYGPLEWDPPVPPPPISDSGMRNPNAITPYIVSVPDGDSIMYKTNRNDAKVYQARLLGVRAADFGLDDEGAVEDKNALLDAIQAASENGDRIWLVRDPELFGDTDNYGRLLAYLWVGDTPYYFPEDFRRHQNPSEGSR